MAGPYKKLCIRGDRWLIVDGENETLAELDTELLADVVMHWLVTGGSPPPDYNRDQAYHTETSKPPIKKTPGVMGGDACIRDTRIAVWMLVEMWEAMESDWNIQKAFPCLTLEDLRAAGYYYRENRKEVEDALREHNNGDV